MTGARSAPPVALAALLMAFASLIGASPARAALPLSAMDSFRLGSTAGIQCSAVSRPADTAAAGMFDRAYALNCRDAAAPVGRLYALRTGTPDPAKRLAAARARMARCEDPRPAALPGLSATLAAKCRLSGEDVAYTVYTLRQGRYLFAAEGLAGYDDALRLGLRSLVADHVVAGAIAATVTAAGDAAAFARAQAGSLDPALALLEAYRRNNGGSYAEASEFFQVLTANEVAKAQRGEFLLGVALQQSNLGSFAEADAMFARVPRDELADPVGGRLARNFRAIHLLNQRRPADALRLLDAPVAFPASEPAAERPEIDAVAAARLNRDATVIRSGASHRLSAEDRVQILDAQALQLRGAALRLKGDDAAATVALRQALAAFDRIAKREIASVARLEAAAHSDLAGIAEARGDFADADRELRTALRLVEAEYPGSLATLSLKARIADFLARQGKTDAALALFREVVAGASASGTVGPGLSQGLTPYFALLVRESAANPALTGDFFTASQLLLRPGVAQTQAVLAHELGEGDDEAARLFRQSVALTRDIDRTRIEIGRMAAIDKPTAEDTIRLATARARLTQLGADQTATAATLNKYPRYRAVATTGLTLAEFQKVLRPGEAYLKLTASGARVYGMLVTRETARLYPVAASTGALARKVGQLRRSIITIEDGRPSTKPYNVALAFELFQDIAGPIAGELKVARHLIYEPDGPMLKLPITPLVTEHAGVDAYAARQTAANADPFDFRGIAWVGRALDVSTSVSPVAFRDLRTTPPSRASGAYLGFGQNAPLAGLALTQATTRGAVGSGPGCTWGPAEWNHPISADELRQTAGVLHGQGTELVTGAAFTDTDIIHRADLANYRVIHFATHGLVTSPHPECPARPALLTSFGGADSDGLLTFGEVFNLHLDADLVILSACDTAGAASVAASREAGVATGGDFALDGLVRAFVGAGARVVVASHWPVPDEYGATKRLISGLFTAPPGTSIAGALRVSQLALMDTAATSHPYYWAAFAVVGDGARPVTRAPAPVPTVALAGPR